jgi:hypothetical protein
MLILLSLLFALPLQAAAPINLTCATNPMTTSFGIRTEGEEVVATVMHSYGSRFAPAINGIFTPNDIEILAARAKLVEKMKDITTFRWPLSKCRRHNDYRFECFGTDDVQDGKDGSKIRPFALYTRRTLEDGIAGKSENLTITLSFNVDGKGDPSIAMEYPIQGCNPTYARP